MLSLAEYPRHFIQMLREQCCPWVHGQRVPSKRDRTPLDRDLWPEPAPDNAHSCWSLAEGLRMLTGGCEWEEPSGPKSTMPAVWSKGGSSVP